METVKISELQTVQEITGDEQIPVEYGGKNYKITPRQIAPYVDVENLQTFDSITGAEKVIVVKDGKAQGLVTLTQIRQVVLPGYTYEDLSMDKFPDLVGGLNTSGIFSLVNFMRIEIPVKKGQVVVISYSSRTAQISKTKFGFVTESLSGLENNSKVPYANNTGSYDINFEEILTLEVPDDAVYLVVNTYQTAPGSSVLQKANCSIQIGELLEDKVEELSARVNLLEQSAVAPAALDSVSREEFDALRNEIEKLKSN